jgi:hypothetical protein
VACLSLDGFWWDARPRHAGRQLELCLWCFRRRRRGGRLGSERRRAGRAFRWTASGGMEDLNTYVYVLSCSVTPGSVLIARAISPDGRYIVGQGYNAATGRNEAFLLDTQAPFSPNGDVNRDGCVDDIDMLGVLFEFGELVNDFNRCVDVNRDGIIDDADLLIVLFTLGMGAKASGYGRGNCARTARVGARFPCPVEPPSCRFPPRREGNPKCRFCPPPAGSPHGVRGTRKARFPLPVPAGVRGDSKPAHSRTLAARLVCYHASYPICSSTTGIGETG